STNAWTPAVFDHINVSPGTCTSCHNGATAEGKPGNHVITSSQCDECHSTLAWIPANFSHDSVTGSCSSCHNGTTAAGKPLNHFLTSQQCDTCHSTFGWVPINFSHSSPAYPGDHAGNPLCTTCHLGNSETVIWTAPGYQPDCAGCHANDYKTGEDDHRDLSQDRDCAGSCHQPTPEHRVNKNDW
ncbi:MAG: cytochrome C, partial [Gammaproteobacteria bacterium]|nr:cytochrome C [Gammaproteobacteria bacterium]